MESERLISERVTEEEVAKHLKGLLDSGHYEILAVAVDKDNPVGLHLLQCQTDVNHAITMAALAFAELLSQKNEDLVLNRMLRDRVMDAIKANDEAHATFVHPDEAAQRNPH